MPPKRLRACDVCHSIKIKCGLSSSEDRKPPCERCVRLGRECTLSPPKRQKDRVAELEAQVEALSKLLESQKLQAEEADSGSRSRSQSQEIFSSKKRRFDETAIRETASNTTTGGIDHIVAPSAQKTIFCRYRDEIIPKFSLVPLGEAVDYDSLRQELPLLLHATVYGACQGILPPEVHDQIGKILIDSLVAAADSEADKTIELVQAIQVAALWYCFPKHQTAMTMDFLIQLAADVGRGVGISGPQTPRDADILSAKVLPNKADVARTWLVCYLLSTMRSIASRTSATVHWGAHEDTLLTFLDYPPHGQAGDRLIAQYVRAERLCDQIATQSEFGDFDSFTDIAQPAERNVTSALRNLLTDWKAQIPPQLACPILTFWEHIARLFLHERVLHTTTNKKTFSAPYVAERLSVTDIPAPSVVTQEHIDAIFALQENAGALLDLYCALDLSTVMALPQIIFVSRLAYTQWILMKLYLATTAPGNTFGSFLNPETLGLDDYLEKVIQLHDQTFQIDPRCGTTRILSAAFRLREFLWNYRATHLPAGSDMTSGAGFDVPLSETSFDAVDWDNLDVAGANVFDTAGLEDFLTGPLPDFDIPMSRP